MSNIIQFDRKKENVSSLDPEYVTEFESFFRKNLPSGMISLNSKSYLEWVDKTLEQMTEANRLSLLGHDGITSCILSGSEKISRYLNTCRYILTPTERVIFLYSGESTCEPGFYPTPVLHFGLGNVLNIQIHQHVYDENIALEYIRENNKRHLGSPVIDSVSIVPESRQNPELQVVEIPIVEKLLEEFYLDSLAINGGWFIHDAGDVFTLSHHHIVANNKVQEWVIGLKKNTYVVKMSK